MVDILSAPPRFPRPPGGASQAMRSSPGAVFDFPTARRRPRSSADLARVIESQIIPRLMLAHAPLERAAPGGAIDARTLDAFIRLTLSHSAVRLTSEVEALMDGGVALEEIFVDLLIPTARRLGDDWNEDAISFTDVTIGLSRLQQVVRDLGHKIPARDAGADAPAACLVVAPGEQHTFGLFILEDGFRRGGWRTHLDTAASAADAVRAVSADAFDVFGLSATSDTDIGAIAVLIAKVRRASRNPRLFVMVGGRVFAENPELVSAVGADAFTDSAAHALFLANDAIKPRMFA